MKNPMFKIYEKIDNSIMYCVNKGVKAWNWTTGQTKADLAKQLLTLAPIGESLGFFMVSPPAGAMLGLYNLFMSHMTQIRNTQQEIDEQKAIENRTLLGPDENREVVHKILGPTWSGVGCYVYLDTLKGEYGLPGSIIGLGYGMRGSSHYVMRADYLPPRKNVFSRAKDKLVDIIQERNLDPVPERVSN